jgi:hypothetical protein
LGALGDGMPPEDEGRGAAWLLLGAGTLRAAPVAAEDVDVDEVLDAAWRVDCVDGVLPKGFVDVVVIVVLLVGAVVVEGALVVGLTRRLLEKMPDKGRLDVVVVAAAAGFAVPAVTELVALLWAAAELDVDVDADADAEEVARRVRGLACGSRLGDWLPGSMFLLVVAVVTCFAGAVASF